MLSRFTHEDTHEEVSPRTRTFDLVGDIRRRRMIFLGKILRMEGDRLVKLTTTVQRNQQLQGDMFDDLPEELEYTDICRLTQDPKMWSQLIMLIGSKHLM